MEYIRIANWGRYQHYKKPRPSWVKLYRDLLSDYEFSRLPDTHKWWFIGLMLLAARHDNIIPLDAKWIARETNSKGPIDLTRLLSMGIIERVYSDSIQPIASDRVREESEKRIPSESEDDGIYFYRIPAVAELLKRYGVESMPHLTGLADACGVNVRQYLQMVKQVLDFPSAGQPKKIDNHIGYVHKIFANDKRALATGAAILWLSEQEKSMGF